MKFTNVSMALVCLLGGVQLAVIKSFPEAHTPELSNVRSKNINVEAKLQLPTAFIEPTPSRSVTPKMKRCARLGEISGGTDPRLSLARRDVEEQHSRRCETCMNSRLCKNLKLCSLCKNVCKNTETNTSDNVSSAQINATRFGPNLIVSSRLKESEENVSNINQPLYYSLGSVEAGPVMRLLVKILNIPSSDNFEKIILLGQLKASKEIPNFHNIVIIDLAQALGSNNKNVAVVHPVSNLDENNVDLVNQVDRKLTQAIDDKLKTKNEDTLDLDEVNTIIDQTMTQFDRPNSPVLGAVEETTTSVEEAITRCSVDETVEDLINILPSAQDYQSRQQPQAKSKEHIHDPSAFNKVDGANQDSQTEIKNPPVIHDNFDIIGRNLGEANSNDATEGPEDQTVDENVAQPSPESENEGEQNVEQSVLKIVEEGLKVIPQGQNLIKNLQARNPAKDENTGDFLEAKPLPDSKNNVLGKPESSGLDQLIPNDLKDNVMKIVGESLQDIPQTESLRQNQFMDAKPLPDSKNNVLGKPEPSGLDQRIPNDLKDNVMKIVGESLKDIPPSENLSQNQFMDAKLLPDSKNNVLGTPEPSGLDQVIPNELKDNVMKIVGESLKDIPPSENLRQNPLQEEAPSSNQDVIKPKQANSENVGKTIEIPRIESEEVPQNIGENGANEVKERLGYQQEDIKQAQDLENSVSEEIKESFKVTSPGAAENTEKLEDKVFDEREDSLRVTPPSDLRDADEGLIVAPPDNLRDDEEEVSNSDDSRATPINQADPEEDLRNVVEETTPNIIAEVGAKTSEELVSRGEFSDDPSFQDNFANFGALVPADNPNGSNRQMQKIYYIGKDINLPLKMFTDEHGIIRLRVDTDALCSCKNETCTKPHVQEQRIQNNAIENKENVVLPELKVRFPGNINEMVPAKVVNSRSETNDFPRIYKRSPKIDYSDSEVSTQPTEEYLENTIIKLNENIKKYDQKNRELVNKGTASLFKEVEEAKKISSMIMLANNMLSWMKDFATKYLRT